MNELLQALQSLVDWAVAVVGGGSLGDSLTTVGAVAVIAVVVGVIAIAALLRAVGKWGVVAVAIGAAAVVVARVVVTR